MSPVEQHDDDCYLKMQTAEAVNHSVGTQPKGLIMRSLFITSAIVAFILPACAPSTPSDSVAVEAPNVTSPQVETPTENTASPDNEAPDAAGEESAKRISVGDKAPNFPLPDQSGKQQTLDDLLAKGSVALVFYRSADW